MFLRFFKLFHLFLRCCRVLFSSTWAYGEHPYTHLSKVRKVKTVWEIDCLQSPPAEASWSFRHVVPSHQLHYPMVPGINWINSLQLDAEKSLIRVETPASLSQERSCRPQRSPGRGVPYSSATSSSPREHLDDFNGFKTDSKCGCETTAWCEMNWFVVLLDMHLVIH